MHLRNTLNSRKFIMTKRQVFFSFDYDQDVFRVAQVKNMGVLEGNPLLSPNEWEEVKRGGDAAIKNWIDVNMQNRSCLVVLIGEKTHESRWVKYEIKKAWNDGKGVVGIYIHNLVCPRNGKSKQGKNLFQDIKMNTLTKKVSDDLLTIMYGTPLSSIVKCFEPVWYDAYNDIANHLESLVEEAIKARQINP